MSLNHTGIEWITVESARDIVLNKDRRTGGQNTIGQFQNRNKLSDETNETVWWIEFCDGLGKIHLIYTQKDEHALIKIIINECGSERSENHSRLMWAQFW